jgi:hypothetical protein
MSDITPELYCTNHPKTATSLRCNRCEKPICKKCAVLTPIGYRCKACVSGQQKVYETARWYDYPLAFCLVGFLSFLGSLLALVLQFFIFFLAPVVGFVISEAARWVIRRRRASKLFKTAALAAALGAIPIVIYGVVIAILAVVFNGASGLFALVDLIWPVAYAIIVTATVYYRMSGIQVNY